MVLVLSNNPMSPLYSGGVRMESTAYLKKTYLVQRLQKADPRGDHGVFTFGGGLRYGGLNKDAWDLITKVFRFDYMGAAEFEDGIVARSIQQIINYSNAGEYATGRIKITGIPIYYLCYKPFESEVKIRIKDLATRKYYRDGNRTKESLLLNESIAARVPSTHVPEKKDIYKYYLDYVGWLELDNDFIFFSEKDVFDNFVQLILSP
jgi:hypothetical protein